MAVITRRRGRNIILYVLLLVHAFVNCSQEMGACCCGLQSSTRAHIAGAYGGGTTEPLLKETEREAVNAILKFLDSGMAKLIQ